MQLGTWSDSFRFSLFFRERLESLLLECFLDSVEDLGLFLTESILLRIFSVVLLFSSEIKSKALVWVPMLLLFFRMDFLFALFDFSSLELQKKWEQNKLY